MMGIIYVLFGSTVLTNQTNQTSTQSMSAVSYSVDFLVRSATDGGSFLEIPLFQNTYYFALSPVFTVGSCIQV